MVPAVNQAVHRLGVDKLITALSTEGKNVGLEKVMATYSRLMAKSTCVAACLVRTGDQRRDPTLVRVWDCLYLNLL